jgi:hypothetical protein
MWFARASKADSAYSLAGWGYKALELAFPLAVGGLVAWAASFRDWIWNEHGLFGALTAGILAALFVGMALFLVAGAFRLIWGVPATPSTTATVAQTGHSTDQTNPQPTAERVQLKLLMRRDQDPLELPGMENVWRWYTYGMLAIEKDTGKQIKLWTQIFGSIPSGQVERPVLHRRHEHESPHPPLLPPAVPDRG